MKERNPHTQFRWNPVDKLEFVGMYDQNVREGREFGLSSSNAQPHILRNRKEVKTHLSAWTFLAHDGHPYSKAPVPSNVSKHSQSCTSRYSTLPSPSLPFSIAGATTLRTSIPSTLYLTFLQSPHCSRCSIPYEKTPVASVGGEIIRLT